MENKGQIYELIGKAIGKIGAIGKDQMNLQQKFKYRGIDQVYNALNPVMAELGIFFCPEVLDMKREERVTRNGTSLTYTILHMKYTAFAPDGSSVSLTVMGEGMDSGDKGCNKAMSVAMKYAMFQLFCIPTEEMKDPDAEVFDDVLPSNVRPQDVQGATTVTTVDKVPAATTAHTQPETPGGFLKRMITQMKAGIPGFDFTAARTELIQAGKVEDVPSAAITMDQARKLVKEMIAYYDAKKAS